MPIIVDDAKLFAAEKKRVLGKDWSRRFKSADTKLEKAIGIKNAGSRSGPPKDTGQQCSKSSPVGRSGQPES